MIVSFSRKSSVFFVLILLALVVSCIAGEAPDFVLPLTANSRGDPPARPYYKLSDQRGKVVLLSFWASWCKPCQEEMPFLQNLWQTYKDSDLVVVGIAIDNKKTQKKAEQIAGQKGITYPIVYDVGQKVIGLYKAQGVPATFLIDKRGNIRYNSAGFTKKSEEVLKAKITELLAELKAKPVIFYGGVECKGKAGGLKAVTDSVLLNCLNKDGRFKIIYFETGSPVEADYLLEGNIIQMGQIVGIDLALKSASGKEVIGQISETCAPNEVLAKMSEMVGKILAKIPFDCW